MPGSGHRAPCLRASAAGAGSGPIRHRRLHRRMAKKRVNELAKQFNLPSDEIRKRLAKAGIELKAAASAVDEEVAVAAITGKPLPNGNGKAQPRHPMPPTGPGLGRPLGTG